jgi:hypothetical protein
MYLRPFKRLIKQLEGHAADGHHGVIWEALPARKHLLKHLKQLKDSVQDIRISECVNNSWAKLNSYYKLTDNNHAAYTAATLLYPAMRMTRFKKSWTGTLKDWIPVMEAKCREVWTTEFLPLVPKKTSTKDSDDTFLREIMGLSEEDKRDEFGKYDSDPHKLAT